MKITKSFSAAKVGDVNSIDAKMLTDIVETYMCKGSIDWVSCSNSYW